MLQLSKLYAKGQMVSRWDFMENEGIIWDSIFVQEYLGNI